MTSLISTQYFDGRFRGEVLTPRHPQYERSRAIFNGLIDRKPAIILQPRNAEDVELGLRFAIDHDLDLALRGGGHNVAGLALVDDGVVVDFRRMKNIAIDLTKATARVQPGVIWGELDAMAQRHSLATTGGIISDTGVAGLTLGGGLGWLMGKHGLSCDNLLSAQVLLANGSIVRASSTENTDLYWALRGGGGNFGIALEFEFRLHPVQQVYAGSVVYPLARVRDAVRCFREVGDAAPDELTMSLVAATDDDGQKVVSLDCCYAGDEEGGRRHTQPLITTLSSILRDTRTVRSYVSWQRHFDDPYRRGRRSYWKSIYLTDLSDDFADTLGELLESAPSPHTMLTFDHVHGYATRVPTHDTAFGKRGNNYLFLVNTNWNDPADDELNTEWTRAAFESVSRFGSDSAYVNYLSQEGQERIVMTYGQSTYDRLRLIKTKYDPRNVFHINQNIEPYPS